MSAKSKKTEKEEVEKTTSKPATKKAEEKDPNAEAKAKAKAEAEKKSEDEAKAKKDAADDAEKKKLADAKEKAAKDAKDKADEEAEAKAKAEKKAMDKIVNGVKEIRVEADRVSQVLMHHSGESSDAFKSLFLGKAWLGKLLHSLNQKNPYSGEKSLSERSNIPPTADTYTIKDFKKEIYDFRLENEVVQIVSLRDSIEKIISAVEDLSFTKDDVKDIRLASIEKTNSYTEFSNAKFHLGNELSKLRK
jgi:flagellar biosynthesis GTPase FlhF